MKQKIRVGRLLSLLCLFALLCACSRYPARADDGTAWDRSWEMLGTALGVEPPGGGFTLRENAVVLAAQDTYYATWTAGESRPFVNEDGEEIDLYPAQIYLLLYGCADAQSAGEALEDWMARERERYDVTQTRQETENGQDFTVLDYTVSSDTNPYAFGSSAFGVFAHYAFVAEVSCTQDWTGDAAETLAEVLEGCHYSAATL